MVCFQHRPYVLALTMPSSYSRGSQTATLAYGGAVNSNYRANLAYNVTGSSVSAVSYLGNTRMGYTKAYSASPRAYTMKTQDWSSPVGQEAPKVYTLDEMVTPQREAPSLAPESINPFIPRMTYQPQQERLYWGSPERGPASNLGRDNSTLDASDLARRIIAERNAIEAQKRDHLQLLVN